MSNSEVVIAPYSKKNIFLRLIDNESFDKWDKIFVKIGACRNNSNDDPGWIISKDKSDLVEDSIYRETKKHKREEKEEDEESESSSEEESEDELIQEVLSRRIKSESDHKIIEETTVDDSDYEDVVSLSRRLRHIYSVLNQLTLTVHKLQDMIHDSNIPLAIPLDEVDEE